MTGVMDISVEVCLGIIARGVTYRNRGEAETARKVFVAALMATHARRPAGGPAQDREHHTAENLPLRALALYNVSLLSLSQGREDEARPLREQATAFLDASAGREWLPPGLKPFFDELMANVLFQLAEYRRALPYCEAAFQFQVDANDAVAMAESLARAGRCFAKIGLRDHAAVPLRAAVKIFRTLAGDPRLPSVLLDLGNAVRKSFPAEAERCYREVADLHVSKAQLESATPAWVNLGVLCNEQGRHAEALAQYEKALHIREQSPRTPPQRIGSLLNNIANVHRRMGNFGPALDFVDRAIPLLESAGGYSLACAFGTRGLILRDAGRDQEAVEWFRKSAAEHQNQPSPNLETLSEELENEASALERMGRPEESADARQRLEAVRATMSSVGSVGLDLGELKPPAEGAVLIELDFGMRAGGATGNNGLKMLERRLSEALKAQETGYYSGKVVIPENTTLMLYGDDAEAVFQTVEPLLRAEPLCHGARITVRQGDQHREVLLPGPVM